MSILADTYVPIDPIQMMFSILNMIIVPLIAGIVAHEILYNKLQWARNVKKLSTIVLVSGVFSLMAIMIGNELLGPLYSGIILGAELIAIVTITKLLLSIVFKLSDSWIDKALPLLPMAAICVFITIIIAQTNDVLMAWLKG